MQISFGTKPSIPPDITPPSKPLGLTAEAISSSEINLEWTPASVTGFYIYRDDVSITNVSGSSYSDTGLDPDTEYTYRIQAFDSSGNLSQLSDPASATTDSDGIVTENLMAQWEPVDFISGDWVTTSSPSLTLSNDGCVKEGDYIRMIIDPEEYANGTSFGSAGAAEVIFGATSVSVSFWVKFTSFGTEGSTYLFDAGANTNAPGVSLVFQNSTTIYGFVQDVDTGNLSLTASITDPTGVWRQFTMVANRDTDVMKIYQNGVEIGSGNEGSTLDGIVSTSNPWYYGKNSGEGALGGMDGLVGQLLMYNKALSPAEVLQNFNASKAYYGL